MREPRPLPPLCRVSYLLKSYYYKQFQICQSSSTSNQIVYLVNSIQIQLLQYITFRPRNESQTMDRHQIVVCEQHRKTETNPLQIPTNYYVCLNRYCPHAYKVLCNICKQEHRDHQVKVLTIEDIAFLMDRLLKMPFKQVGTYIIESIEILKKLKLVNEFSSKMANILTELQQESLDFITLTENLISDYAQCKTSALQVAEILTEVDSKESFQIFKSEAVKKLSKVDYNMQKDRLEYGSLEIKEKEDLRKKSLTFIKRRVEQVKEYSMKVIQVILNNDESDEEEHDMAIKKKLYEKLKAEINELIESEKTLKHEEKEAVILQQFKQPEKADAQIETDGIWIEELQETVKSLKRQLQVSSIMSKKQETEYKTKLQSLQRDKQVLMRQKDALVKEREALRKEKEKIIKQFEQKCEFFSHYEHRLRDNYQKRVVRCRERDEIIKQLTELVEHRRMDTRRESVQKENRNSKGKKD